MLRRTERMHRRAANVPSPLKEGEIVEFTEDVYQLSDFRLFDLEEAISKAESQRTDTKPNLFQEDSNLVIGGSYTTEIGALKYRETVMKKIQDILEDGSSLYFQRFRRGQKVKITAGKNRGDVILSNPDGKVISAMPLEIVQFLISNE